MEDRLSQTGGTEDDTYYLLGLDIIGQQQGDTWSYFGYDGLGSVRQVYDSLGAVGYATSYAPYGELLEQYGSLTTSLGFTGEYTDTSGLLYLRARYLNTDLGTFLTKDPVEGFLGGESIRWNGYIYAHANAISLTDPSGQFIPIIGAFFGAIAGAAMGGLFGAAYGKYMYDRAMHCDCGQDRKDQAEALGQSAFIWASVKIGAAFGFVIGAAIGSGLGWAQVIAGRAVQAAGVLGFLQAGQDILANRLNSCNALDILLSLIMIRGGTSLVRSGRDMVPDPARSVGRGSPPGEEPPLPGSSGSGGTTPPGGSGGTVVLSGLARAITFTRDSLQHMFTSSGGRSHAPDFGVTGNWNNANASLLETALRNFVADPTVQQIVGKYRGDPVIHYFKASTRQWLATDMNGNFIVGWILSRIQENNLFTSGNVQ